MDDSSTDNTDAVLAEYIAKDPRFKYFHRPDTHLPGGNGARNYGFLQCKGECIQWFDSDDLMHPEKLEKKVQSFKTQKVDLVVSKSEYFNSDKESYPYNFTTENINFESFSMGNVTWITNDFMIRREIALQTTFNENLRAGQEYNYVCKALLLTDKVFFINDFLTKRRKGVESIGNNRVKSKKKYLETRFMSYWLTCKDVSTMVNHSEYQKFSLLTCVSCYLRSGNSIVLPQGFVEELKKVFKNKVLYFHLAKISNRLFRRYHFFYKKLKQN